MSWAATIWAAPYSRWPMAPCNSLPMTSTLTSIANWATATTEGELRHESLVGFPPGDRITGERGSRLRRGRAATLESDRCGHLRRRTGVVRGHLFRPGCDPGKYRGSGHGADRQRALHDQSELWPHH